MDSTQKDSAGIEMSQIGSKNDKPMPQLPRLAIPASDKTNPFSAVSPMMSATTSPMGDLDYPAWTPSSASSKASSLRGGELPLWTPIGAGGSPQTAVGMSIKAVKPPRPISKDPPRPMTASTKRLTVTRYDKPRPVKFGTGKDGDIELVPQPSDDSEDPLVSFRITFRRNICLT